MKKSILALALAALMLLGCAAAFADGDNVLHVYTDRVFRSFNQVTGSDTNLMDVIGSVSEGLVRLDENHNPQPALAESYTISEA